MSEQDTDDATSTDETQDTGSEETQTDAQTGAEDAALGEAGEKALTAWKERARVAEKKVRDAEAAAAKAQAELALKDKPAEEQELEKARADARAEATSAANKRIIRSELKALATGKLADPTDAALYINLDDFTVTDDGDVDSDALNDAISALLEKKPHLAAQKQNRFDGDADQGAKGKTSGPAQLSQADLDRMVAAGDTDGIEKARVEGRFNGLLGIKS